MADKLIVSKSKVTALFDAIRNKAGITDAKTFDEMIEIVNNLQVVVPPVVKTLNLRYDEYSYVVRVNKYNPDYTNLASPISYVELSTTSQAVELEVGYVYIITNNTYDTAVGSIKVLTTGGINDLGDMILISDSNGVDGAVLMSADGTLASMFTEGGTYDLRLKLT